MCQYSIRPVQQIQDYLMNLTTIDDTQIYQMSLQLEARKNKSECVTPSTRNKSTFTKQIATIFGWTKKK